MWIPRNSAAVLLGCALSCGVATGKENQQDAGTAAQVAKAAKQSKAHLIGRDDGLAVISAALDAHTRRSARTDCSHLVHDIYQRAGFAYSYASSSDLYAGADEFRPVQHPQPGDLVVWPGHVGIVVNPAQRSFYSALSSGLGVDVYDSAYWKQRGRPRFFRHVKRPASANHPGNTGLTK